VRPRPSASLVGLKCQVITQKGSQVFEGVVVDETAGMIFLMTEKGVKKLAKKGAVIRVSAGGVVLEVNGKQLIGRPLYRLKRLRRVWSKPSE
jgi:ribonuclease P protein subunit POP4